MKSPHPLQRILTMDASLPWLAALLGILVASWIIFQSQGIINRDGLFYIEIARQFSLGNWHQGLALYNWPVYPLMITAVHQASQLSLLASAQAITIVAFAWTCAGMVVLARELGGNRHVMIATALLLLCSTPLIDNYLPMALRDHTFLALHVWSLVFFLRFYRNEGWGHAAAWGVTAALAVLLRIEGVVYLSLLPLILLARRQHSWRHNLIALLRANLVLLGATIALVAAAFLHPGFDTHKLGRLGDPLAVGQMFIQQISQGLSAKADTYADHVLGKYLNDVAMPGLLLTLAYALLSKVATSAGWLQLALAVYARLRIGKPFPQYHAILCWVVVLSLLTAIVIITSVFLLPKRYLLSLAMIIVLYAAQGAAKLYEDWQREPRPAAIRWRSHIAVVALVLTYAVVLNPANPKDTFEMDAARWVVQHTEPGSRIYYDDGRLDYYVSGNSVSREIAEWGEIEKLFSTNRIADFDYVLVHVPRKSPEREQFLTRELGAAPLASFENARGKRVLIYRVTPRRPPATP